MLKCVNAGGAWFTFACKDFYQSNVGKKHPITFTKQDIITSFGEKKKVFYNVFTIASYYTPLWFGWQY